MIKGVRFLMAGSVSLGLFSYLVLPFTPVDLTSEGLLLQDQILVDSEDAEEFFEDVEQDFSKYFAVDKGEALPFKW